MITRRDALTTIAGVLPGGNQLAASEEDTKKEINNLKKMVDEIFGMMERLRLTSPPIGSVQAFAGVWPPHKPDPDGRKSTWTEWEIGWLLCDGRKLDDVEKKLREELGKVPEREILADLRQVLPHLQGGNPAVELPNYCGMFLRGVDLRMDRTTTGKDKLDEENKSRVVGSVQQCATKLPQKGFKTTQDGGHRHDLELEFTASRVWKGNPIINNTVANGGGRNVKNKVAILLDGVHGHEIVGGDDETRPVNIAVNYIIKYR